MQNVASKMGIYKKCILINRASNTLMMTKNVKRECNTQSIKQSSYISRHILWTNKIVAERNRVLALLGSEQRNFGPNFGMLGLDFLASFNGLRNF